MYSKLIILKYIWSDYRIILKNAIKKNDMILFDFIEKTKMVFI